MPINGGFLTVGSLVAASGRRVRTTGALCDSESRVLIVDLSLVFVNHLPTAGVLDVQPYHPSTRLSSLAFRRTMCPELLAIAITSEDPKPRAERRPELPPCMSSSHVRNPFESPGYGIVGGGGRDWRMVQAGVLYMSGEYRLSSNGRNDPHLLSAGPTPPDILRVNADIEDVLQVCTSSWYESRSRPE